jgi:hypothetical protein
MKSWKLFYHLFKEVKLQGETLEKTAHFPYKNKQFKGSQISSCKFKIAVENLV